MDLVLPPRFAARLDWVQTGEFNPDRFQGEERREYLDEAERIERQWGAEYYHYWS